MPEIRIANIGSYPRIGDEKDHQRFRRGYGHFIRKEISAHAFRDVVQSVTQEVIQEQVNASLDEITDGLINWIDPISHFSKHLTQVHCDGIYRYFHHNFYYLKPIIKGKPRRKEPLLAPEYAYAKTVTTKPIRSICTGPITLASHTDGIVAPFKTFSGRLNFFCDFLLQELEDLEKSGARSIQINEPSLIHHFQFLPAIHKFFEQIRSLHKNLYITLSLPYSCTEDQLRRLIGLPVHALHINTTKFSGTELRLLQNLSFHYDLALGVVNAETTKIEIEEKTIKLIRNLKMSSSRDILLTPTMGLEFLPRDTAKNKLLKLSELKKTLTGRN